MYAFQKVCVSSSRPGGCWLYIWSKSGRLLNDQCPKIGWGLVLEAGRAEERAVAETLDILIHRSCMKYVESMSAMSMSILSHYHLLTTVMGTRLFVNISVGQYSTFALLFEDMKPILVILLPWGSARTDPSSHTQSWIGIPWLREIPTLVMLKNKIDSTYLVKSGSILKAGKSQLALTSDQPLARPQPLSQHWCLRSLPLLLPRKSQCPLGPGAHGEQPSSDQALIPQQTLAWLSSGPAPAHNRFPSLYIGLSQLIPFSEHHPLGLNSHESKIWIVVIVLTKVGCLQLHEYYSIVDDTGRAFFTFCT